MDTDLPVKVEGAALFADVPPDFTSSYRSIYRVDGIRRGAEGITPSFKC